jgi:hypothetical protein
MIGMSRTAQAVKGEEGVQQAQAEPTSHLTCHPSLNVRGVHAGDSLDEDDHKPNSTKEKRLVRRRFSPKRCTGLEGPISPRLRQ